MTAYSSHGDPPGRFGFTPAENLRLMTSRCIITHPHYQQEAWSSGLNTVGEPEDKEWRAFRGEREFTAPFPQVAPAILHLL